MYEKIKDMIERNDFHTAERMIEKHEITLSAHETKSLIHLMKKAKKALKTKAKKAKPNRFIEFFHKHVNVVFNIAMFFFGCCLVCCLLMVGPKHSMWTPFRRFWGRLFRMFLGLGFLFLGIWESCIFRKRISKFTIWGLLLLLFCIFEQIYIRGI